MRKLVFELYDYECADCGERNRRKLQVHHLDHDRKNNSIENLILVCYMCHALIYHPYKAESIIIWAEQRLEKGECYF